MRMHFAGAAVAALIVIGPALPGYANDAPAAPAAPTATQTFTPARTEAPPASVPRPSLAPKAAGPAAPEAADDPAPSRHRRYAHRYHRRHGYYRTGYWEPFPIYWPHFYRSRVYWSRTPWAFNF